MFRFVVVSFEILALIMVLRSDFVQYWLSDLQTSASQWMDQVANVVENQQLSEFREDIKNYSQNLKPAQEEYIDKITENKAQLTRFNQHYCVAGDKNPFIYGVNLRYLCSEIQRKKIIKEVV
ncbi:hypothetical protein [Paraglaciecola aestuariivivens]